MYQTMETQLSVYDYITPLEERLSPDNRWLCLAREIDWLSLDAEYSRHFSTKGKPALPVRLAFGSLVIAQVMGLSDKDTIALVNENPYMQAFLGLKEFTDHVPLSRRSMSRYRQRFSPEQVTQTAKRLAEMF